MSRLSDEKLADVERDAREIGAVYVIALCEEVRELRSLSAPPQTPPEGIEGMVREYGSTCCAVGFARGAETHDDRERARADAALAAVLSTIGALRRDALEEAARLIDREGCRCTDCRLEKNLDMATRIRSLAASPAPRGDPDRCTACGSFIGCRNCYGKRVVIVSGGQETNTPWQTEVPCPSCAAPRGDPDGEIDCTCLAPHPACLNCNGTGKVTP